MAHTAVLMLGGSLAFLLGWWARGRAIQSIINHSQESIRLAEERIRREVHLDHDR